MPLRTAYWRSVVANGRRSFATSIHSEHTHKPSKYMKWDYMPIGVLLGLLMVAGSIGAHTAKQKLVYSPAVQVNKKRRESVPEVDDPDHVVGDAKKFMNKSFLRKVGNIQDRSTLSDHSVKPNPYTR